MKIKIKWLFFLVCLLLLSNLTVLFAQNTNLAPPAMVVPQEIEKQVKDALRTGSVTLNFENLDVKILAKIISEITGKNIIVDDRVKGDVTIFSSTPVSINEAWNIFIAAVKAKGFEVVQLKKYTKILPEIKNKDFKLSKDYISSPGEELVIAIAILKNANAVELQKSLMALISSTGGSISAYQPNNTIIIVDNSSNIKKLISIIKQMDVVPKQQALRVYNPRYINVTMLTASLEKILRDPDIRFSAYEQTNSMLAYIPQNKVRSVEEIIRNLDRPSFTKERTMRIYYLQNASCEDLVKTLSLMLKEKERVEIKETSPGGVQTASVTDKKSVF